MLDDLSVKKLLQFTQNYDIYLILLIIFAIILCRNLFYIYADQIRYFTD